MSLLVVECECSKFLVKVYLRKISLDLYLIWSYDLNLVKGIRVTTPKFT